MTLKLRILRSFTRLFIILISLTRSLFSEKMLISNRCISGLMFNLIKKSWTVSILQLTLCNVICLIDRSDERWLTRQHNSHTGFYQKTVGQKKRNKSQALPIEDLSNKEDGIMLVMFVCLIWGFGSLLIFSGSFCGNP